ncbi:MAG: hydantoinase B/oxoprolinase family protein [Myxococcota bacterium]|nr:hydantoinase B/oxoprolinase family protein [Myxococcota bacterium]
MADTPWQFWIDRGGTFTDVIGLAPDGGLHTAKLLSSDTAPVEGVRRVLHEASGLAPDAPPPACVVKLGTTVATNALLERRGAPTLLVATRGLGDVFRIGTQERPELFDLHIRKPAPLPARTVEAVGRVGVAGDAVEAPDDDALRAALAEARAAGLESVAVVAIHAYAHPDLEQRWAALAREAGFPYVVASHEIAREQGLLARGETAIADAYLTPLLQRHVYELKGALPGSRLRFMQSSGGLTEAARFRGPNALLSGPAGGVVGAARVAAAAGFERAIGFDMGGTSTDVSLLVRGDVERGFETLVAGIRVRAPMLRIHTVAAGGGSLCRFDGFRLTVGPESAGADPGPVCYRLGGRELALTDVNLALGRLQPDRFPLALDAAPVGEALGALEQQLSKAGLAMSRDEIAAGFVEIANASMAQAIQQVSVARGVDPRDCALVGFGGAGGQHVCQVARSLGMRRVLLHPLAGLLSAYGIGVADVSWDGQRDAGREPLGAGGRPPVRVGPVFATLEREGRAALAAEGAAPETVRVERVLDLRYAGTEAPLAVDEPADGDWEAAFARAHDTRFGYTRPGRPVEVVTARVRARAPGAPDQEIHTGAEPAAAGAPEPLRHADAWFPDVGRTSAPVYAREALGPGSDIAGPAIVLEDTGTVVIDPGFTARVGAGGVLDLEDRGGPERPAHLDLSRPDPVRLEVFGNRFMSIAEQMGAVLRNTSVSTNIKERLDYSCAVFDGAGGLVANAPHIPVHLGAMEETVQVLHAAFPDLAPGDVLVSNDPFEGGSHLPDVTVVTPVFVPGRRTPAFYLGSRGHHADLGGKSPGSMPADSRTLEEEGVVLHAFRLVREGRFDEARLRAVLTGGRFPARRPDDNVADLEAMVAANRAGERLLLEMARTLGSEAVETTMQQLQAAAAGKVAREIGRLPDGEHGFRDRLDDGTPVVVSLRVDGERMTIDFAGTGPAVAGNLNAPRAVVRAAVIYVLRALVAERIPLNGGCLAPVEIRIPPGSLLDPPPGSAVVGGNVETSQRVVDVLLGALGLTAASQGTMNNVTFGHEGFGYYETIGGGAGAGPDFAGASGVHVHMTNTRITDAEVLEARYPVRLLEFALRPGSGGAGRRRGGDGLVRRYEFLDPVVVSLLTQRRAVAPFGLEGGASGAPGRNRVERGDGRVEAVDAQATLALGAGDRLVIETPGGGGFGLPDGEPSPSFRPGA